MIDRGKLETYLINVSHRFGGDAHAELMRFMCRCMAQVKMNLPAEGRSALDLAKLFWFEGSTRSQALVDARIECWNYLDTKAGGAGVGDQEEAAMRAVICVLYPEPESDDFSAETARWFADMLDRLGDFSHETASLMQD